MWVFAVAQIEGFVEAESESFGEAAALAEFKLFAIGLGSANALKSRSDSGIVGRSRGKCFLGQSPLRLQRERSLAALHFLRNRFVVNRRGDDGDVLEIIGCRPHHRRAPDVSVLKKCL